MVIEESVGKRVHRRAKELEPIRKKIEEELERNDGLMAVSTVALQYGVSKTTVHGWVKKWRIKHATKISETMAPEAIKKGLSWEQVLEIVPDTEILGALLVEGFVKIVENKDKRIAELDGELMETQEEIKKVSEQYNNLLAKKNVGHLTVDAVKHRLIPKER